MKEKTKVYILVEYSYDWYEFTDIKAVAATKQKAKQIWKERFKEAAPLALTKTLKKIYHVKDTVHFRIEEHEVHE